MQVARGGGELGGREAVLGRLLADVDLEESGDGEPGPGRLALEIEGDGDPVDGVEGAEAAESGADLVRLQRAEQVPVDCRR